MKLESVGYYLKHAFLLSSFGKQLSKCPWPMYMYVWCVQEAKGIYLQSSMTLNMLSISFPDLAMSKGETSHHTGNCSQPHVKASSLVTCRKTEMVLIENSL